MRIAPPSPLALTPPALLIALVACGATLPKPALAPQPENAFIEVPEPPPAAKIEVVPPRPNGSTTWVDGAWAWEGSRWRWADGGWFAVPAGTRYADWVAKRRADGTVLYANPQWLDDRGAPAQSPPRLAPAPTLGTEKPQGAT